MRLSWREIRTRAARFAEELRQIGKLHGGGIVEDHLKEPVATLLKEAGQTLGVADIRTRTEEKVKELSARPDMGVFVNGLVCGYIELKIPGKGANPARFSSKHDKKQWNRLKSLPNLVYTDGREWALYRFGERTGPLVRLDGVPEEGGADAVSEKNAKELARLLHDFLNWQPIVPHKPRELAQYLAPLTRYLREQVVEALEDKNADIRSLSKEWRKLFFPEADDERFADAYAQTVTYALLLARLRGANDLKPEKARDRLEDEYGVLATALKLLGQREARDDLQPAFDLLQRSLEALDPQDFAAGQAEAWLYFYEDFLAAYDPKLRKDYGVYYTPLEVVQLQVRLAAEILGQRFGKKLGFADDDVIFLDPAAGTGTYLLAAVQHGLATVRKRYGVDTGRLETLADNLHGFEILVGPYAVAHTRLLQEFRTCDPAWNRPLKVYLADTLESPHHPAEKMLAYKQLAEEHEAARRLKQEGHILVCLGNPPYDREQKEAGDESARKGGWVRFGTRVHHAAAKSEEHGERPILEDFLEPAKQAGAGEHLKNLYNDYVYFWRWALWRLFEQQEGGGIITFITAASYLTGPGFIGMREVMRRTFDELWILDLGGDNLGARKTPNVFSIQIPVAIAIGVRGERENPDRPATVRYARIEAPTREGKLKRLAHIARLADVDWQECPADWHAPFRPAISGEYAKWPTITQLFPWQHSGLQFKRTWPIAESKKALQRRFRALLQAPKEKKNELFKPTRDRTIGSVVRSVNGRKLPPLATLPADASAPPIVPYAYRSFDRQFCILDMRLGDFLRPPLLRAHGPRQVYLSSLLTKPVGTGPALTACAELPDLDHFCGRGAKDNIPLYRDSAGHRANVTQGLLEQLAEAHGRPVRAEDLFAAVYALLAHPGYVERFWHELEAPPPRVPLPRNGELFARAVELGRRLLWLHTYGERMHDAAQDRPRGTVPQGRARMKKAPTDLPEGHDYDVEKQELRLGDGLFTGISPQVWNYEVSGLKVVQSWLDYRKKNRKGRKSSQLDDIRPERWEPHLNEELLELLWVLEETLVLHDQQKELLDAVTAGRCFTSDELPQPSPEEKEEPKPGADDETAPRLL